MSYHAKTIVKNILWAITIILIFILIEFLYRIFEYFTHTESIISLLFLLYLPATLLSVLVIWKKPCSLFILPISLFVSWLFDLLWVSILWSYSTIFIASILLGIIYFMPFTAITLITAILNKPQKL